MTFASTLALALALMVLAVTPGPGLMAIIGCALGRGFAASAAMAVGIVLGDLVFVLFATFGLTLLAHALGDFFVVVKLAGAAYLVWLGARLLLSRPEPLAAETAAPAGRKGLLRSTLAGFLITLGNPKVIVFYVGFLPTFVDLKALGAGDLLVIAATVLVTIGGVLLVVAGIAGRARRFLASGRRRVWMNRGAGAVMVGAGVAIATR